MHGVAPLELDEDRIHAVVSAMPRADTEVIRSLGRSVVLLAPGGEAAARAALDAAAASGSAPPVVVGDADAWASSWSLAATIRELAVVVVHGGASEYRALVRERELPPLLDDGVRQCWVARPGEQVVRAAWPTPSTTTETAPQTNNTH